GSVCLIYLFRLFYETDCFLLCHGQISLCRLRCLVKQLDKGEVNVVDLRKNIEYAASVLEASTLLLFKHSYLYLQQLAGGVSHSSEEYSCSARSPQKSASQLVGRAMCEIGWPPPSPGRWKWCADGRKKSPGSAASFTPFRLGSLLNGIYSVCYPRVSMFTIIRNDLQLAST
uniref:Uncharacterized protein n=1 Tax=Sinocyclocheilus grahami TaxID=75366 RepID=A0A672K6V9_SINGR